MLPIGPKHNLLKRKRKCLRQFKQKLAQIANELNPLLSFIKPEDIKMAFILGAKNAHRCTRKNIAELRKANKQTGKVIKNIAEPKKAGKHTNCTVNLKKASKPVRNIANTIPIKVEHNVL